MSVDEYRAVLARFEKIADRLESGGGGSGAAPAMNGAASAAASHEHVLRFEDVLEKLKQFLALTDQIGNDVLKQQTNLVAKAFSLIKDFVVMSTQCKPPADDKALSNLPLFKELSKTIADIGDVREKNRANKDVFNHLSAISESIAALAWVAVKPAPAPHVKEMADAAQFYTNRILREYKEKDPKHAEWTKAWIALFKELEVYVKKYHTTGISWNRNGSDPASFKGGAAGGPPAPPRGGAPPPPPPPTVEQLQKLEISSKPKPAAPSGDREGLFRDLQKGEGITAHLKKVDRSQMTHKNPELRAGNVVRDDDIKKSGSPKKAWAPPAAAKPPLIELQNSKKWVVEYQKGNNEIVLDNVNMKQTAYVYKCENSTIQVKGKINSITLDSCKKVGLVYGDVVSTVDIVNCQSVQVQSEGVVPTIAISKTDGCQVYLSEKSLNAEVITSKSSEMNVLVPSANGFDEMAVPEQFKTVYNGKKLVTTMTEIV